MTLNDRVALNIQDVRHFRGLSQETLAANAGVSRGYMGKIENAKHSMTLHKLEAVAVALEIDPLVVLMPRVGNRASLVSFIINKGGYVDLPHD